MVTLAALKMVTVLKMMALTPATNVIKLFTSVINGSS